MGYEKNTKIGILSAIHNDIEEQEIDLAFESVFDMAMEATSKKNIISPAVRKNLPDSAFGVIYRTKEGEVKKLYPLIVKDNKQQTEELINRAIEYFNYCNPLYKSQLAENILKAINTTGIKVKIHPRNAINKFVTIPPKYIATNTVDKYSESKS